MALSSSGSFTLLSGNDVQEPYLSQNISDTRRAWWRRYCATRRGQEPAKNIGGIHGSLAFSLHLRVWISSINNIMSPSACGDFIIQIALRRTLEFTFIICAPASGAPMSRGSKVSFVFSDSRAHRNHALYAIGQMRTRQQRSFGTHPISIGLFFVRRLRICNTAYLVVTSYDRIKFAGVRVR